MTTTQHDWHLTAWLLSAYGLTVGRHGEEFSCWEGDYDLDCHAVTGSTVFYAAYEWAACYRGMLSDMLVAIELGESPAIEQLHELVAAGAMR